MHLVMALSKRDFDRIIVDGLGAGVSGTLYRFESAMLPRTADNVLLEADIPAGELTRRMPAEALEALDDEALPLSPELTRRTFALADEWLLTHDPRRRRSLKPTTLPRSRAWGAAAAILATTAFLILSAMLVVFIPFAILFFALSVWLVFKSVRQASRVRTPPAFTLRHSEPKVRTRLIPSP